MFKEKLKQKLREKTAKIGVIGMGYVGLPLALRFAEVGFLVKCFDISEERINLLNAGKSYIQHISVDRIMTAKHHGMIAYTDFSKVKEADAIILCVPTPLNKYREPDLNAVISSVEQILPYLQQGQIISLESTTYPGTTDEELKPRIENNGFTIGEDIFLIFSPEREDPGNPEFHTANTPKVCGGITKNCLELGEALYEQIVPSVIKVSSTRAAEMTKLIENIHRAVNIGLMNELKKVAYKMEIDIFEVIEAAATKPFGFVPYYPGPGIGGHCIPIDPFYLTWKAREFGIHTRFIELAGEINSGMPTWVVGRLTNALNDRGKSVKGSRILVLGLAYKKNVDDIRESPSIELINLLLEAGAKVDYADPHVLYFKQYHGKNYNMKSVDITAANLKNYDVVLISTAHGAFDFDLIKEHAELIIDTRGKFHTENSQKIVKA